MALEEFRAPALPIAPLDYDRDYVNRVNQLLRTYFNLLDSDIANKAYSYRATSFIGGGYALIFPYVAASDGSDQYASGDDTPTLVLWDTQEANYGFSFDPSGYAAPTYAGEYKIDFSLQFTNTDNTAHDVFVWLTVNGGGPIANSSSRFTVPPRKSVGNNGYAVAYSSVVFQAQAGDEIRLYWATDKAYNSTGPVDGVFMEHMPAQTSPYVRPANPSAVGSITFLSAIP